MTFASSCAHLMLACALFVGFARCESPTDRRAPEVIVHDLDTGTDAQLIGLSVVSSAVWWVGGSRGTVLRTIDGGESWQTFSVPEADSLQFRDVAAFDESLAFVLSIGPGRQSRIYRTDTGGQLWRQVWIGDDPDDFLDCFDFWSPNAGLTMGDVREGRIAILGTDDGTTWTRADSASVPLAIGTEGGFAASGTCLVTAGDSLAWIATGSPEGSRIYRTENRGRTWSASDVDFAKGMEAGGLMSLAFRNQDNGFAAGGILSRPDESRSNLFETRDGGVHWTRMEGPQLPNVYGLAISPGPRMHALLAVGPKGMDVSIDDGATWHSVDKRNYWSVQFADEKMAVAVGPRGRASVVQLVDP